MGRETVAETEKTYSSEELKAMGEKSIPSGTFTILPGLSIKNSKGRSCLRPCRRFALAEEEPEERRSSLLNQPGLSSTWKRMLEDAGYGGKLAFSGSNGDQIRGTFMRNGSPAMKGSDTVTGSKTAVMRAALVECFANDAEIMIATEDNRRRINLQFCSLVVNYDLPWNPSASSRG